jgi:hypothetical protein
VTAELEPSSGLRVEREQDAVEGCVEHEHARGEVVGPAGPGHAVGMLLEMGDKPEAQGFLLRRLWRPRAEDPKRVGVKGHS